MPTTYFISRHPGAIDWAGRHGLSVQHVDHLDTDTIGAGDTVIGTLPVHLAAAVCERGARYVHLRLDLPRGHRGQELSADDMDRFGARLEGYVVSAASIEI